MRFIINKIWQFKLPVMLLTVVLLGAWIGPMLPVKVQSFLYFLSLTFTDLLIFVLPFIIFSLVLSSLVHLKGGAMRLVLILIPLLCLSNYIAIWVAYLAGNVIVGSADIITISDVSTRVLEPTWHLAVPTLIKSPHAMILAVIVGLTSAVYFPERGQRVAVVLTRITAFILNKLVLPCLPFMILGFVIKMQYDDVLEAMVHNYAYIFCTVALLQVSYIVGWYIIINKFKTGAWITNLKNMFPPLITAFSTMSSAVTMPLTLIATRKNVHDPDVANFVIPSTVNFHLIGDCLAMPVFFMAVMVAYGFQLPTVSEYFTFSLFYLIARFSGAGIPGGGAIILMPLLRAQFGFTADMLGMMPTLNLMFDSMITAMNVLANGAFAILFGKIYHRLKKPEQPAATAMVNRESPQDA